MRRSEKSVSLCILRSLIPDVVHGFISWVHPVPYLINAIFPVRGKRQQDDFAISACIRAWMLW